MSTSKRQIFFNHFNQLLHVKHDLSDLLQICKLHPVWDLQPLTLVSYFEELERQLRDREDGIKDIQLELKVN